MKKHIVFVTGRYTPEGSANVNCVTNVIHELKQCGYKVSVVCASSVKTGTDILDDVNIHRIQYTNYASKLSSCRSPLKKGLLILGHFIKSAFLLPAYPNVTPAISHKAYKKLLYIHEHEKIDCIISVYQPYFPIQAALLFKNKFRTIPVIGYYLDVMKGANKPFGVPQRFFERLCDIAQKRDFAKLDKILLPECSRSYYDIEHYEKSHSKIRYLNFPTLLKENYIGESAQHSMRLVYAGTTNSVYRNPVPAIRLLTELKALYPDLVFHLYGNTDMKAQLMQLQSQSEGAFIYHGVVKKEFADLALRQADYCINFGNNVQGMVPSKIFELIATGKNIIHFSPGPMDSSVEYFKKYPKAHIIDCRKPDIEIKDELRQVFAQERIAVSYDAIEQLFYSATPKAVVTMILELLSI